MQVSVVQFRPWAPLDRSPLFSTGRDRLISQINSVGYARQRSSQIGMGHWQSESVLVSLLVSKQALSQRYQHMLNDIRIRQAKPRDRDYKLTDYDGLHLLVRPKGAKLWHSVPVFGDRLQGALASGIGPIPHSGATSPRCILR
jgi:hypothetical protein